MGKYFLMVTEKGYGLLVDHEELDKIPKGYSMMGMKTSDESGPCVGAVLVRDYEPVYLLLSDGVVVEVSDIPKPMPMKHRGVKLVELEGNKVVSVFTGHFERRI